MLWFFIWEEGRPPFPLKEKELDFIAGHGFDFIRIPTDYRHWTHNHRYFDMDETVLGRIDGTIDACRQRKLHASLNLHRAPGYCVNRNDLEIHNLWTDTEAQDAFVHQWESFARRYRGISGEELSFDLLNEPPRIGNHGCTRENHQAVMRRTVAAIRAIDPDRPIVLDGVSCGNEAIPELGDLDVVHSGRGYAPFTLSHHKAGWIDFKSEWPEPVWPHKASGKSWDRAALKEFYQPWRAVEDAGTPVHIGEFGCYEYTPQEAALAWFRDLLGLYKEFRWGYALWNFDGAFGIIGHHRPGAQFERVDGFQVDRQLLDLLVEHRV